MADLLCSGSSSLQKLLAANKRAQRVLREQQRRDAAKASRFGLGPQAARSVLAAYVLSGHSASVAAILAQQLYKPKLEDVEVNWEEAVENLYLATSLDELMKLHDESDESAVRAVSTAQTFLAKAAVADWVVDQNYRHGVAPSCAQVRGKYQAALHLSSQGDAQPADWENVELKQRSVNRWAQRWAKAWGFRRGRLPCHEDLPEEEIARKARRIVFW